MRTNYGGEEIWHCREFMVPPGMRDSIKEYIEKHRPVGSFLEAIISNNLRESFIAADDFNFGNVAAYVYFFYNYGPRDCWGSKEVYLEWIAKGEQDDRD